VQGMVFSTNHFDAIISPHPFINRLKSPPFQVAQIIVGK
jgi:hypothetical protein